MKAELILSEELIDAIAYRVVELIKPLLSGNGKKMEEDSIFDVQGLAQYLKVDESWVYKQVSMKKIPYFKNGKYTRFKKKDIEKWIDSQKVPLLTPLKLLKKAG